ncbi:hypothetical protein NHQ30_001753 [Ciborinia camelliae]|nr:hypothetical protein NHQ30_001753 [Ciborinia camelliae]
MNGQETPSRWPCQFQGCTKSFQRKEHLTRHQKSHSATSPAHVCRICRKEFSRGDGLQRHLGRHGEQFKKPAGRSRRACASCHSSKIKCDGNDPCSRCERKRIPCEYNLRQESPGQSSNAIHPVQTSNSIETSNPDQSFNVIRTSNPISISKSNSIEALNPVQTSNRIETSNPDQPFNVFRTPNPSSLGLVDWSNLRIQQDTPQAQEEPKNTLLPVSKLDHLCSLTKQTVDRYRALYFTHFHDRWPIIHSPSYEGDEEAPELLLPSILMIGGWIDGTVSSRDWALEVHHNLVEHILPRLCQPNVIDAMTQPLPIVLYQCTLLNIIFGSYCGRSDIVTKGLVLRNLLATSIYDVGILTSGTIYVDDKPGLFLPLHLVKQQQRQRLAVDLFKIDTYFSIIKGQPPLFRPEELHFSIPETVAHWNAGGLPTWEVRRLDEPKSRSQRSINMMLEDVTLGVIDFSESESMLEDIQICLWAMQSQISQLSKKAQPGRRNEIGLNLQRESLKRQLESLKRGLTKLSTKISGPERFEQAQNSPVRYYYGTEDHDEPGWKDIVSQRIYNFILDTSILYHLMNLQLCTETQTIRMLARDSALPDNIQGVFREVYTHPHTQRVSAARAWTQESNSRRALWHASEILLSHKKTNTTPSLANLIPDSISYIALASAALVIWAHCMYGQETCNTLAPTSISVPHEVGISIELTKLSEVISGSSYDEKGKEVWIEGAAYFRASIENVQLCSCNTGILMEKFRVHIPHDWEIVEEIAPNILGQA